MSTTPGHITRLMRECDEALQQLAAAKLQVTTENQLRRTAELQAATLRRQCAQLREDINSLADQLTQAQAERDQLREHAATVEGQRDEALRDVEGLRRAMDDTGRPVTSLADRVSRLEAIHESRERARAAFRASMRP